MLLAPGQTSIRRALVHATEPDTLAWRGHFERALAAADLRPPSLPPAAILCVRRLRSEIGPFRSRGEPDFRSTDAWQRRAVAALEELVRQAARPARGMVPPNALAVLFADYAELLACLALDSCRGEAVGRWWWAALFPGLAPPDAVHKAWAESPQHVPAALSRLYEVGHSGVFLRALPGGVVAELSVSVACAFGLETLRPILTQAIELKSAQRIGSDVRALVPSERPPAARRQERRSGAPAWAEAAPWSDWVQVEPALPAAAQALLIVSVMLERAPVVVRSLAFARLVRNWTEGTPPEKLIASANPSLRSPTGSHPQAQKPRRTAGAERALPPDRRIKAAFEQTGPAALPTVGAALESEPANTRVASEPPLQDVAPTRASVPEPQLLDQPRPSPEACAPEPPLLEPARGSLSVRAPLVPLAEPPRQSLSTDWGGVLYLVNVALSLGLYGDFTMPRAPGLALPVWDFLALVGRRMIGPELEADPLWQLLAALSGRGPDEPPGHYFEPPAEWRMPAAWLAAFPERSGWIGSTTGARVRLKHPQGFFVCDVPVRGGEVRAQLEDESSAYGLALADLVTDTPAATRSGPTDNPAGAQLELPTQGFPSGIDAHRQPAVPLTVNLRRAARFWSAVTESAKSPLWPGLRSRLRNSSLTLPTRSKAATPKTPAPQSKTLARPSGFLSSQRERVFRGILASSVSIPTGEGASARTAGEGRSGSSPQANDTTDCQVSESSNPVKSAALARWLDWLVPFLQARLARALGAHDPADLRALVFHHPALVEVNSDRLEARFSLATHPMELRLAGLDRDPGWVPAAGRQIIFHYE